MFRTILTSLHTLPYFSSSTVMQLSGKSLIATHHYLYRLQKTQQIVRLKRDTYMTREFMMRAIEKDGFLEMVSSIIQPHSYVSREFILQKYGILTEMSFPITGVTLKNTAQVQNQFGYFLYAHLKPSLYTGYTIHQLFQIPFARATKAKALFDYFYLRPFSQEEKNKRDLAQELRLNLFDWHQSDITEFFKHIETSKSLKMKTIGDNLRKGVWTT